MSKSVIELCDCKPEKMLSASLFCPHSFVRYENKIRDEYLITLAANLDAEVWEAAKTEFLHPRHLKTAFSDPFKDLEAAIKAYLNTLIKEEKL